MSALLGFTIFVTMLGVGIIAPFLPWYAEQMGASGTMLGLIFGALAGARLAATPYVGDLSDVHGRKWFLVAGLAMLGLTSLGYIWAANPWHLVLVRVLQGLSASMVLPVAMALAADSTVRGSEGRGMGNFNTAFLLGWGLGPLVGGVIYDLLGLESNFLILAGLSLLVAVLAGARLREPPRSEPVRASGGGWRGSLFLMRDRTLALAMICRAGAAAQVATVVAFVPLLCEEMGLAAWQVGAFITVNVMVMTSLQMPAGRLADRMAKGPLVVGGQLVAAAGMVCLPLAHGFFWLAALAVLMGVGSGLALPAMTALVVARGKDLEAGMGLTMGLFNSAFSVGVVIGPVAAGWVGDLTVYTSAFYVAGAMCGLSALSLVFLKE